MEIQQTLCVCVCVSLCVCVCVCGILPACVKTVHDQAQQLNFTFLYTSPMNGKMLKIKYTNTYQTYKFLVLGRQLHLKKDKDFSKHPGLVLLKVNHETAGIQMKVLKSHSKNHSLGGDVQEH